MHTETETGTIAPTSCSCSADVENCRTQPGSLRPGDAEAIAGYLGITVEELKPRLRASPGAVVLDTRTGTLFRIGTITPSMERGRCTFLTDAGRCSIHAVAPAGCRYFDVHMSRAEGQRRSVWLLKQQVSEEYQLLRATLPPAESWRPRPV